MYDRGACYKVITFPTNFDKAQEICLSKQSTLVTIETSSQGRDLKTMIQLSRHLSSVFFTGNPFLGMYRPSATEPFASVDGSLLSHLPWISGHPAGSTELCVEYREDGSIAATDCNTPHSFVCEKYDGEAHLDICAKYMYSI